MYGKYLVFSTYIQDVVILLQLQVFVEDFRVKYMHIYNVSTVSFICFRLHVYIHQNVKYCFDPGTLFLTFN